MAIRSKYTKDEKRTVLRMVEEGKTYKEIAQMLRPGVKSAWRTVGEIAREGKKNASSPIAAKSGIQLPPGLDKSASAREFMAILDTDQQKLLVATYEDLRGESTEDQLTPAENEMLIRAAYSHVRYIRAQNMLSRCESFLIDELEGRLNNTEEDKVKKRHAGRADVYKRDAELAHNEYMELLEGLKLTRKQRLDKIKDTRNTFLDLQIELTNQNKQRSLIEDIKKINNATREELIRMSKGEAGPNGEVFQWLIGAFENVASKEEIKQPEESTNEPS